jgi:hypothetical protein
MEVVSMAFDPQQIPHYRRRKKHALRTQNNTESSFAKKRFSIKVSFPAQHRTPPDISPNPVLSFNSKSDPTNPSTEAKGSLDTAIAIRVRCSFGVALPGLPSPP